MRTYSQLGQDILAEKIFDRTPPIKKVFIDVGAFDGFNFSNTYLFYLSGWTGICIEACSKNFIKLEKLYRDSEIRTIKAACADYEGEAELNISTIPGSEEWGSDVSSLNSNVINEWSDYIWETEKVHVTTLNKILEKENISNIDYLSIDVEGLELSVLRGLDLNKFTPSLIITEYHDSEEKKLIKEYLMNYGYFVLEDNCQDLFFVKRGIKNKMFMIELEIKKFFEKLYNKLFISQN